MARKGTVWVVRRRFHLYNNFSTQDRESLLADAADKYMRGFLSLEEFQEIMDKNDIDYAEISMKFARSSTKKNLWALYLFGDDGFLKFFKRFREVLMKHSHS
ncbi:MAG: hypothetical protein AAGA75_21915 [Cyanobacteria bacterium P01_E01_bin.6]